MHKLIVLLVLVGLAAGKFFNISARVTDGALSAINIKIAVYCRILRDNLQSWREMQVQTSDKLQILER